MKALHITIWGLLLIAAGTPSRAQSGAELFKANCGYCHTIGKGDLTGPDLKGTMGRYSEKWLISWIRSSTAMIEKGDKKAIALYEKYNQINMPDQELSDDQIREIIAYVGSHSSQPVKKVEQAENKTLPAGKAATADTVVLAMAPVPVAPEASLPAQAVSVVADEPGMDNSTAVYLLYTAVALILVLVGILFFMRNLVRALSDELSMAYRAKHGKAPVTNR